jgi:hypothetical protein
MGQVKVNNKGKLQLKNCTIFDGILPTKVDELTQKLRVAHIVVFL